MRRTLGKWLYALFILFSVASVVFWLFHYSFKNAEEMLLGQQSDEATRLSIRKELGLDQAAHIQYAYFIRDLSPVAIYPSDQKPAVAQISISHLSDKELILKLPYLRRSFINKRPVGVLLAEAFTGTLILALLSIGIASFLGIIAGMIAAAFRDQWPDRLIIVLSTMGISVPSFFSAVIFSWLFGYVLKDITGLHMNGSLRDIDPFKGEVWVLKNLWLPALALGVRPLSIIVQLTRSSTLDVIHSDFVRTARSKGLHPIKVFRKHILLNAINPVITSISGWFASLLAGAFFVEYVFNYRGIGKLTIEALENNDLPVVMGAVLCVASVFVFINIAVDYVYKWIDPRIR